MKWIFGLFFLCFAVFSFGLRVHPQNAASRFQKESFENYGVLDFFSGRRLAGRIVSESADSVEVTIGDGTVVFKRNEIQSLRRLAPEEVEAGEYRRLMIQSAKTQKPLVTIRYEDSLFYQAEKRAEGLLARVMARMSKEGVDLNPLSSRLPLEPQPLSADRFSEEHFPEGERPSGKNFEPADPQSFGTNNVQANNYEALIQAGLQQLRQADQ